MRRFLAGSVFILLAAGAFALPGAMAHGGPWMGDPSAKALNAEITAILDQNAQTQLGTMTIGDLEKLEGQISIAIQKEEYINAVRRASFFMPGMGQLRTGDTLGGSLFLAGDIAVTAGTLLGAYFLLPSNVQFAHLDYLDTSVSSIHSTWYSNTLADYAPSIAVAVGGMAAQMILRWVSAKDAEAKAREAVASGKVTFQPQLVPLFGPLGLDGRPGIGFGWRGR
jgi:hypothetical protein